MRTNKIMLLTGILMNFWNMTLIKRSLGIPWWSSGWTSCSHCRGPRFNPWLGNYDPKSHTAHSKSKKTNKQTKHILYGSIYMFPPTLPYMSFEIRCNESMVAKLALCLPLERVPGRNTGELLGVVIASLKWKCYPLEDEPLQCDLGPADLGHEFISQYRQVVTAVPQTHA